MSTQSIREVSIESIQEKIDLSLAHIGNRYILEERFGVKTRFIQKDIFSLLYFKKFFKYRRANQEITTEMELRINKLISKYA